MLVAQTPSKGDLKPLSCDLDRKAFVFANSLDLFEQCQPPLLRTLLPFLFRPETL